MAGRVLLEVFGSASQEALPKETWIKVLGTLTLTLFLEVIIMKKRNVCFIVLVSLLLIFFLKSFALPPRESLPSFECSGGITSIGDIKSDVIAKCGEPTSVEKSWDKTSERWTYYSGPTEFIYYLEFQGGRLEGIERSED